MLTLFVSSVSGNLSVKKRQQHMLDVLESRRISFSIVDIATPEGAKWKEQLREGPGGLALPQLWAVASPEVFVTDYDRFLQAIENNCINELLSIN